MRSDRLLLRDILDAIAEVGQYLPQDRVEFDSNPMLQSHIHRHIMIIGEAACRLSKATKAAAPEIPWRRVEEEQSAVYAENMFGRWGTRLASRSAKPVASQTFAHDAL